MKEFNLEAALNGEPVKLRNGQKAIVCYRVPDKCLFEDGEPAAFPLHGIIFARDGYIKDAAACWRDNGTYGQKNSVFDIIGMWEEPIDPKDLPKPFIPNQGERYYSISPDYDEPEYKYAITLNHPSIQNGNCFRTEEDAQKWIDFMKSMME